MFLNVFRVRGAEFLQRRFIKNVTTLQVGTIIGTLIQGITGIILARLLQPNLFGVYTLAFSLSTLATILLSAGIADAATNLLGAAYTRGDREEVANIFGFLLKITLYAILITLLVILILPRVGTTLYLNSKIGLYAGIISFAVMFSSLSLTFLMIALQLLGRIKDMTRFMIVDPLLRLGLSVLFVTLGWGVFGAMAGHLVGAFIVFIYSSYIWRHVVIKENSIFPNLGKIFSHAKLVKLKKYFGFTFWVALDRNIGSLYIALPILLTGLYVAVSEVTYFKLAFGYLNLVMSLLVPVSILSNVEFPKIRVEQPSYLRERFKKISFYSLAFSAVLTLVAVIIAPYFFRYLYGVSFMPSVRYVYGLVIYGALYGIGIGLGSMWRAINKVKVSILINIIILGVGIPLGMYLIKVWSLWGSVAMVTLWFTISHWISFIYLMRKLKQI